MKKMKKPKWTDAPGWAHYLAQDSTRDWYWYEENPTYNKATGSWTVSFGRYLKVGEIDYGSSLERRP